MRPDLFSTNIQAQLLPTPTTIELTWLWGNMICRTTSSAPCSSCATIITLNNRPTWSCCCCCAASRAPFPAPTASAEPPAAPPAAAPGSATSSSAWSDGSPVAAAPAAPSPLCAELPSVAAGCDVTSAVPPAAPSAACAGLGFGGGVDALPGPIPLPCAAKLQETRMTGRAVGWVRSGEVGSG